MRRGRAGGGRPGRPGSSSAAAADRHPPTRRTRRRAAAPAEPPCWPSRCVPVVPTTSPEVLAPRRHRPPTPTGRARPVRPAWTAPTMTLPALATGLVIQPGMELPMPDESTPAARPRPAGHPRPRRRRPRRAAAGRRVRRRRPRAAPCPQPWRVAARAAAARRPRRRRRRRRADPASPARRADQARGRRGPDRPARRRRRRRRSRSSTHRRRAAMEDGPVLTPTRSTSALRYGWRLAEEAADAGVDVLVLGAVRQRHGGGRRGRAGRDHRRRAGRACSAGWSRPAPRSTTTPG